MLTTAGFESEDALLRASYFGYDLGGNNCRAIVARRSGQGQLFCLRCPQSAGGADVARSGNNLLRLRRPRAGNVTAVVGPRWAESSAAAFTTYYAYAPGSNALVVRTDPLGGQRTYSYTWSNKVGVVNDERGGQTLLFYDVLDQIAGGQDAAGNAWFDNLDAEGNLTYRLLPTGNALAFAYDSENRLIRWQDAATVATYYARDAAGNRIRSMRVQSDHTAYFGYDPLNRLMQVQDAVGSNSYFAYDVGGNLNRSMDPNLHTTYFGYDLIDRIVQVEDANFNTSYFGYDLAGNRCREEDANQHTVYYQYDAGNRVTAIEDALQASSYYAYDLASNLTIQRDNIGNSIYFAYDALDRKTAQLFNADGTAQYFAYDPTSNLTTTLDAWGASYFLYDPLNRVSRRADPASHAMYYAYDPVSNVARLQYPGTSGSAYYGYDSGNRMAQANLVTGSSDTCYYAYDSFGNLSRKMFFNNVTCYYAYDNAERVTGMDYRKSDNTQVGLFTFSRDAGGRITQEFDNSYGVYYTYDAGDRLLSETYYAGGSEEVYAFNYGYDAVGNRMKMSQRVSGSLVASSYFAYNSDNSMTQRAVITPAPSTVSSYFYYDANGAQVKEWDMETGDTTYFTYAPNGMISSITPPSGSGDAWTCDYDARLNRYKSKNGSQDEKYQIQEGLKLLEERTTSGDTPTARNLHGISPVPDIGMLVEIQNDLNGTPVSYAPLMDHRGTVYALVDASGNIVAQRHYNAFGVILYAWGNWGTAANPILAGYQTNWMTVNIGGKWYGISAARVYDFETGRFLSKDPVPSVVKVSSSGGNGLGIFARTKLAKSIILGAYLSDYVTYVKWFLNTYRAWSSNPQNEVDPSGMSALVLAPAAAGAGVGGTAAGVAEGGALAGGAAVAVPVVAAAALAVGAANYGDTVFPEAEAGEGLAYYFNEWMASDLFDKTPTVGPVDKMRDWLRNHASAQAAEDEADARAQAQAQAAKRKAWEDAEERKAQARKNNAKNKAKDCGTWCSCPVRPNNWKDVMKKYSTGNWNDILMKLGCPTFAIGTGTDKDSCEKDAEKSIPEQCRQFIGHCFVHTRDD